MELFAKMKKYFIWFIVGLSLIVVYSMFNPSDSPIFPKCPFLLLTGYKCPGCGTQRAIYSLLHFNIVQAFKYNAMLVISIPVIVLYLYAEYIRKRSPEFYSKLHKVRIILSIFICFVTWGILRNIFGF